MNSIRSPRRWLCREGKLSEELGLTDPATVQADPVADPELSKQAEDVAARVLRLDLDDHGAQEQTKLAFESMAIELQKESSRRSANAQAAAERADQARTRTVAKSPTA